LQIYDEILFVLTANQKSFIIAFVHASDTHTLYQFTRKKIFCLEGIEETETFIGAAGLKLYYARIDDLPNALLPDQGPASPQKISNQRG
jgi:hypothetical protein